MRLSVAAATDETGRVLAASRRPWAMSLHTTSRDWLQIRLNELLTDLQQRLGVGDNELADATVCIGLTGVTFPYDAQIDLPAELDELPWKFRKLVCTGDAEIVFASHAKRCSGSAVLCHVGSTAFAVSEAGSRRYGGWGPALGDEGSGYWMGRSALRAIGQEYDEGLEQSALWKRVEAWLESPDHHVHAWALASATWRKIASECSSAAHSFDRRTAVFRFAHEITGASADQWRQVVSGLTAPLMQACYVDKDASAELIVEEAASMLVNQYSQVRRLAAVSSADPIVLYGGVLTHNPPFRDRLYGMIRDRFPDIGPLVVPGEGGAMRPVCGALLYALGESDAGGLRLPSASIIATLEEHSRAWSQLSND